MPSWTPLFAAPLSDVDDVICDQIEAQRAQNVATVNLIASESYAPRATIEAEASALINCNSSGYPPRESLGGSGIIDRVERLAAERARALFGAEHANVQALSSTIANVAVIRALVPRGGRILSFAPAAGGHVSHGGARHLSGQDFEVRHFGLEGEADTVDYEAAESAARAFRPHLIIAGSSAYPRIIDFARLRALADDVGALLVADVAHVSGLIVAGLHPDPVPICDVVTTSTHKTLCGPRTGGLILSRSRFADAIDAAVSPGLQAAPGAHIMAARAVLFDLVARPAFRELMGAVVQHAKMLAAGLQRAGVPLFTDGSETHMVVVDLRSSSFERSELIRVLFEHGIVASAVGLPARSGRGAGVGLRLGSTAMTIRGADAPMFADIAEVIAMVLDNPSSRAVLPELRERMVRLAQHCPVPFQ